MGLGTVCVLWVVRLLTAYRRRGWGRRWRRQRLDFRLHRLRYALKLRNRLMRDMMVVVTFLNLVEGRGILERACSSNVTKDQLNVVGGSTLASRDIRCMMRSMTGMET